MAAERKVIDVDESPELIRLIDQISASEEGAVLRRNGQAVAAIRPLKGRRTRRQRPTQEDIDAFKAAAGAWKDLVDGDQLIADIYADRDAEIREPVET
jgi:hypothetical protein